MTNFQTIDNKYVKGNKEVLIVKSEKDAVTLVEAGYTLKKLLVFQDNLAPDFFDLSTKLAGEVLQKLVNYGIKTAFVVDSDSIKSEYFKQLINEAENLDGYRFFDSEEKAVNWLENS